MRGSISLAVGALLCLSCGSQPLSPPPDEHKAVEAYLKAYSTYLKTVGDPSRDVTKMVYRYKEMKRHSTLAMVRAAGEDLTKAEEARKVLLTESVPDRCQHFSTLTRDVATLLVELMIQVDRMFDAKGTDEAEVERLTDKLARMSDAALAEYHRLEPFAAEKTNS